MVHPALIVGANGQLASAIAKAAPVECHCVRLTRTELDICSGPVLAAAIARHQPSLVINGAAYNLVDKAEGDGIDEAFRVNAVGPALLAEACRNAGVPLVHFSTDFVFDGAKQTPYSEDDIARPLGVYGASKLAGENVVLAASPLNYAIRVCRLFGPVSKNGAGSSKKPSGNFPLLMIRLGSERTSVRVVDDQVGAPSYTPDLARAVWQLVPHAPGGLYHLANAGEVSFADYAREIFRLAGVDCAVESVSSAEYGAPARRPLYSTLNCAKAYSSGVTPLRPWQDALVEFLSTTDSE